MRRIAFSLSVLVAVVAAVLLVGSPALSFARSVPAQELGGFSEAPKLAAPVSAAEAEAIALEVSALDARHAGGVKPGALASFSVTVKDLSELGIPHPEWMFGEPSMRLVMYESRGLPVPGGVEDVAVRVIQIIDVDRGFPTITMVTSRPEIPAAVEVLAARMAAK